MNTASTALSTDATLSVQYRVRHPSRSTTVEYWTLNARGSNGRRTVTLGDFGRFTTKAEAQAALVAARLDLRTRAASAFTTLAELVAAHYTPTLSDTVLADAYDAAQAALGSDRRAYRRS